MRIFKLESNMQLTRAEALRTYRRRAGVEHPMSSLKMITGIKPIRVWRRGSADDAMIPAFLAEAAVAMARYCMEGEDVEDTDTEGNRIVRMRGPSTESIVRSLSGLTLMIYRGERGRYGSVLSNWEPISTEIIGIIQAREARNGAIGRSTSGRYPFDGPNVDDARPAGSADAMAFDSTLTHTSTCAYGKNCRSQGELNPHAVLPSCFLWIFSHGTQYGLNGTLWYLNPFFRIWTIIVR